PLANLRHSRLDELALRLGQIERLSPRCFALKFRPVWIVIDEFFAGPVVSAINGRSPVAVQTSRIGANRDVPRLSCHERIVLSHHAASHTRASRGVSPRCSTVNKIPLRTAPHARTHPPDRHDPAREVLLIAN